MSTPIMIGQGDVFGSASPCVVSTILGSCVAVCLYDSRRKIGGINHFVVPASLADDAGDTRSGPQAVASLIERMLDLGCLPGNLTAKIFGGAVPPWVSPQSPFAIGASNAGIARELLARSGIPVVADHTGGPHGVKIYFETGSGDVYLKRIPRTMPAA